MSKKIITLPHESLREKSSKVHVVTEDIKKLIKDMSDATLDWEASREHEVGVALAAVQIDSLTRVVIIREDFNDKSNKNFDVFINPKIVKYEGDIEEEFEGCLSIKNVYGKVPRHTKVRISAMTLDGTEIRIKAEGFLARVFQHEIDHTNGVMFVDHIEGQPDKLYKLDDNGKIKKLKDEELTNAVRILW